MTGEAEHLFILVGYLYVCFGKMSLQILSLHFNCCFFFFLLLLVLSCVSSLYVLDISSLFNTRFARLPGGALYRNLPTNAGVMGVIPGLERFYMPWSN